ncbi:hypothetical protein Plhal304r1_c091g0171831 [Plasmopara halstedii]
MMQESNVLALRDDYEWWTHDAHIVDVRDLESGEPVDFVKSRGKYLQRVEPLAAILDPNYFITLFEKHNLRMDSRSAKRKRTDTSRVITSERTLEDVELELLHALEERLKKKRRRRTRTRSNLSLSKMKIMTNQMMNRFQVANTKILELKSIVKLEI